MTEESFILIVEDEKKIAALLADFFKAQGFRTRVLYRGDQVLDFIAQTPPDLIVLDIMLPGMDGTEICQKLRQKNDIPIIILTAKIEEADVLKGLELGADDYITKPFSPREVVARAKAVLRRTHNGMVCREIVSGSFVLDLMTQQLLINRRPIALTPTEFGILKLLLSRPDTIVSRELMAEKVRGYRFEGYNRTIDTHIKNLRKKISDVLPSALPIVSVYGAGYKFIPVHSHSQNNRSE